MKIYLAAPYGDMMKMRDVRDQLAAAGHEVTAQWIDGFEGMARPGQESNSDEVKAQGALMDAEDVRRSDVLVAFTRERHQPTPGGGRHVEFGIALERGIPIVLFGPIGEHVFHYYPGLVQGSVSDMAQLIGVLITLDNDGSGCDDD